jgi:hypothetical protein
MSEAAGGSSNDEWRLQIEIHEDHLRHLIASLDAEQLEHELSDAFRDRVIVSRDGGRLFLYAGSREQAERAHGLIATLAEQHGWTVETELRRWHPIAEEWEDPDDPLPDSEAARKAEHAELVGDELEAVAETGGEPQFEVRVELPSRREAHELAKRLRGEGMEPVGRWRYLLVGAADEDIAKELAERLRAEAPDAESVGVEGTWKTVYGERPNNPFAVFGGLGG